MSLKYIAEQLNVSISTVSRALQQKQNGISTKTKLKIREFAKSIDFTPNINASNLRTKTSNLIGVIVPTISNNFYESFLSALEENARKNGYSVMILQSNNQVENEIENIKLLKQNNIAYLFVCLSQHVTNLTHFDNLIKQNIPVIFFDKVPMENQYKKISISDEASTIMACEALLKVSKKNIVGIFGNKNYSITKNRENSFKKFFEHNAPNIHIHIEHADNTEAAFNCVQKLWINNKPDSIFCMTDEILIGVMKFIQSNNIKYPKQVKIITLSNGFIPSLYFPSISYIETSGYEMGKQAFSLISNTNNHHVLIQPIFKSGNSL